MVRWGYGGALETRIRRVRLHSSVACFGKIPALTLETPIRQYKVKYWAHTTVRPREIVCEAVRRDK